MGYIGSSHMSETSFSHASSSRMANSIAYGHDGKAFGVIPKDYIDIISNSDSDWASRSMAVESIYDTI